MYLFFKALITVRILHQSVCLLDYLAPLLVHKRHENGDLSTFCSYLITQCPAQYLTH